MTRLDEEDRVLPMDQFYHALRFSSQDDTLDLFDIENILVSLISQVTDLSKRNLNKICYLIKQC